MTIHPIGTAGVALYLTPADLHPYGVTPDRLTLDQALLLTRQACARAGIPLDGALEIEAYPEYCGVLVFAHVRPAPLWFTFDALEPLLRAALALRHAPVDAALWWQEGRYWLALPPAAEEAAALCARCGTPQPADPLRPSRLDASGHTIFRHNALSALCYHFGLLLLG